MKNNYGSTDIKLGDENQIINYYIIKGENDSYGISIEKEIDGALKEKTEVKNISNNENVVRNIIDEIISNNNDLEQLKYVIEDNSVSQKV